MPVKDKHNNLKNDKISNSRLQSWKGTEKKTNNADELTTLQEKTVFSTLWLTHRVPMCQRSAWHDQRTLHEAKDWTSSVWGTRTSFLYEVSFYRQKTQEHGLMCSHWRSFVFFSTTKTNFYQDQKVNSGNNSWLCSNWSMHEVATSNKERILPSSRVLYRALLGVNADSGMLKLLKPLLSLG